MTATAKSPTKPAPPPTKSQQTERDLTALLKARNTLLWIVTREEKRVEGTIIEAAAAAKYETRLWDVADGLVDASGDQVGGRNTRDPNAMLATIPAGDGRFVYVLRDMHKWLDGVVLRKVRNLARSLQSTPRQNARAMVILTPSAEVPPELAGHATVIDFPLPERPEIARILDSVMGALPDELREAAGVVNGARDASIDAAVGLTAEEASNCYAKSLVTSRTIDPSIVADEKKRIIAREKVLTWSDPDPRGLDAVGGLDNLKSWLTTRRVALSQRARDFGLPAPKGVMLVGVPGCGKSLTAKAVAAAWELPLLRLDMGALKSKWVGESEGNIRRALQVAETVAPCVLWLDEIEKALSGSSSGAADGGVSSDALGTVLNWMQERVGSVFVVATANDVSQLPPELLRKGRFDDLFFVDLPNAEERAEIIRATLGQYGRDLDDQTIETVVAVTEDYTGAELAALVPDALFAAFADDEREITGDDLVAAAGTVAPLARTAAEKIEALRKWAVGRTRPATSVVGKSTTDTGARAIDF